jgi:hypothetical protein
MKEIKNIKITEFGERHFDKKFGGTKILDFSKKDFNDNINLELKRYYENKKNGLYEIDINPYQALIQPNIKIYDGYADFCKLIAIKNFTKAKIGSTLITLENFQYLRSGYSSRRESELPVFSRWLELPLDKPQAKWLFLVLYSKEQIDKEAKKETIKKCAENCTPNEFNADWGIVAILGQNSSKEEPMKPETMLRNALGIDEGGSGVKLNKEKYLESVAFWDKNATIK